MTPNDPLHRAIHERIEIVPYDALWPSTFQAEADRLLTLFPEEFLALEHVGSTAVPGLSAKPIIDILGAVPSMEAADVLLPKLCRAAYVTSPEYNRTLRTSRWLMRHEEGRRTHHLHLVLPDSREWLEKRCFRDALRANPLWAAEYESLKRQLASSLGADREAYGDAKGDFIRRILESAD